MLPKDLLVDLEKGDRTKDFMAKDESGDVSPPSTLNELASVMMQQAQMSGLQFQQYANQPVQQAWGSFGTAAGTAWGGTNSWR